MSETTVTWLGHSTFLVESSAGTRILIEPWVESNPACPDPAPDLGKLDLILCTHGHDDHIGDAADLAASTGATVVGIVELCAYLSTTKGISEERLAPMNKGGTQRFGDVTVTMVNAFHSSSAKAADGTLVYTGEAAGLVVRLEDGYTIYHAGDTTLFGDMRLIGELYSPDLAILPIGDFYTMDPRQGAYAARLVGARDVLGMHYGTWPVLTGTPAALREELGDGFRVHTLQPGESTVFAREHATA